MFGKLVISALEIMLVVCYAAGVFYYGYLFFKRNPENKTKLLKYCGLTLKLIILFHLSYFIVSSAYYRHAPITNIFELASLVAFGVTITYQYIEYRTKVYETGFFILSVAAIFQLLSALFIKESSEINPILRSWLLGVHVSAALIGYSAIIISGIYGFLYLMLYRNLKIGRTGNFYKNLPSLHLLEQLAGNSIVFGFFFLTITVLIGIIWLPQAIKDFSLSDPKLIATAIVWLIYGIGFVSVKMVRVQSKTSMTLAFLGFLFTVLSVFIINIFLESFHKFY